MFSFHWIVHCLDCRQCPIGIFGQCFFGSDLTCNNATQSCYRGEASKENYHLSLFGAFSWWSQFYFFLCSQSSMRQDPSPCTSAAAWIQTCVGRHWPAAFWGHHTPAVSSVVLQICVTEPRRHTSLWLWPFVPPSCPPSGAPGSHSVTCLTGPMNVCVL